MFKYRQFFILHFIVMKKWIFVFVLLISIFPNCFAVTQSQRDTILNLHNMIRSHYNLPKLVWDMNIEKQAQSWADSLQKTGVFAHSSSIFRKWMWENLYTSVSSGQKLLLNWYDAVTSWLNEWQDYDYNSNTCKSWSLCGHFTQIVWKNTTKIGCGQSTRKKWKITTLYWVCEYDPPGNYVGERPY